MTKKETKKEVKKETKDEYKEISKEFKLPRNKWKTFAIVLIIILAVSIFTGGFGIKEGGISESEAKQKVSDYIENVLNVKPELSDFVRAPRFYKFKIALMGQEFISCLSTDGKHLISNCEGIDITEEIPAAQQQPAQEIPKTEKPNVELFVMAECPYGTQIEKGILSVIETLKDKINFELKFCDYAMHGAKEVNEQLSQYCIQKQQNEKFTEYLTCFLKDGESKKCVTQTGIDETQLKTCIEETDTEFKVTELLEDESTWVNGRFPQFNVYKKENDKYGVQGSPSLVINGQQVSSQRDSQSLLTTICGAFTETPEECEQELSSAQPNPGFGFETTGAGSTEAQCA